jgi:hypothetical protein
MWRYAASLAMFLAEFPIGGVEDEFVDVLTGIT